jgi:hypothetical protein
MNTATTTRTLVEWARDYNNSNNAGGPWIGQGYTAGYRIDHGDGWALLSVYADSETGNYRDRSFGSVSAAKTAARRIEGKRQQARGVDSFDPEEVTKVVTPTFEHGFALGLVAFADGRAAVPALDPAATAPVASVPVGGATEFFRGWLAGWHSANLLPTEEVSK